MPPCVYTDRRMSSMSEEIRSFLGEVGIATSKTTLYNSQGNEQPERMNGAVWRTITLALKSKGLTALQRELGAAGCSLFYTVFTVHCNQCHATWAASLLQSKFDIRNFSTNLTYYTWNSTLAPRCQINQRMTCSMDMFVFRIKEKIPSSFVAWLPLIILNAHISKIPWVQIPTHPPIQKTSPQIYPRSYPVMTLKPFMLTKSKHQIQHLFLYNKNVPTHKTYATKKLVPSRQLSFAIKPLGRTAYYSVTVFTWFLS